MASVLEILGLDCGDSDSRVLLHVVGEGARLLGCHAVLNWWTVLGDQTRSLIRGVCLKHSLSSDKISLSI